MLNLKLIILVIAFSFNSNYSCASLNCDTHNEIVVIKFNTSSISIWYLF